MKILQRRTRILGVLILAFVCAIFIVKRVIFLKTSASAVPDLALKASADAQAQSKQASTSAKPVEATSRNVEHIMLSKKRVTTTTPSTVPLSQQTKNLLAETDQERRQRLTPLFDEIVHTDGNRVFQSTIAAAETLFESESPDPSWSDTSKQQLQDRLDAEFGDQFDTNSLECKTDICEIRLSAPNSANPIQDMSFFQDFWGSDESLTWMDQQGFDDHVISTSTIDGTPLIVMFISRH